MNLDDFIYHKSKIPADYIECESFFEKLRQQWFHDLETDPKYDAFFGNQYTPESIRRFKYWHAINKVEMCKGYEIFDKLYQQSKDIPFRRETEDIFKLIKQKKLFNAQLLWRAGKLRLPNVHTYMHFYYWESYIDHCPFVNDITEQEVEVMKQFLLHDNFDDKTREWLDRWQDYRTITSKDEEGEYEYMPEWYEFYDSHLGTGYLLDLPDVVGPIENRYNQAAGAHMTQEREEELKKNPPPPREIKESLHSNAAYEMLFAQKFESDPQMHYLYQAYAYVKGEEEENRDSRFRLIEAMDLLFTANEPPTLQSDIPWHDAILLAAQTYKNKIIIEQLDTIYEEHNLFNNLHIGHDPDKIKDSYYMDNLIKMAEERILLGRKLLGEPENFDYLNDL